MKSLLTCLVNSQTGHHSPPIMFETKEMAVTTFIHEVQTTNSELANIKDSLAIYAIGYFDHKTGKISQKLFNHKQLLISGSEVVIPTSQKEN